jgi:hypothetical protein
MSAAKTIEEIKDWCQRSINATQLVIDLPAVRFALQRDQVLREIRLGIEALRAAENLALGELYNRPPLSDGQREP